MCNAPTPELWSTAGWLTTTLTRRKIGVVISAVSYLGVEPQTFPWLSNAAERRLGATARSVSNVNRQGTICFRHGATKNDAQFASGLGLVSLQTGAICPTTAASSYSNQRQRSAGNSGASPGRLIARIKRGSGPTAVLLWCLRWLTHGLTRLPHSLASFGSKLAYWKYSSSPTVSMTLSN